MTNNCFHLHLQPKDPYEYRKSKVLRLKKIFCSVGPDSWSLFDHKISAKKNVHDSLQYVFEIMIWLKVFMRVCKKFNSHGYKMNLLGYVDTWNSIYS